MAVGNVRESSLVDIMAGSAVADVRRRIDSPSEPGAVLDLSDEAAPPDVGRGHRVARHILGRTSDQRATGPESERSLLSGGCTPTVV